MGILDIFRGSKDERIARRVIAELRKLGDTRRLEYSANDGVILAYEGGEERSGTLGLHNLRHELDRADKSEHDEIYQRYASGLTLEASKVARAYSDVRDTLGVLLKDLNYPSYIELMNRVELGATKSDPLVWRPVVADVIACVVQENVNSLAFVKQSDLETWQVDAGQVLEDAVANVRAREMEIHAIENCHGVLAQDSFIAARLLCTEKFSGLSLNGLPVAVIPDRDTLFVTGSEDEDGIASLSRLVNRQLVEATRHISMRPLVLTAEGWREFEPPQTAHAAFGNAIRVFDGNNWAAFQALYEKDLKERGEDVFVAQLSVHEDKSSGDCFTSFVWPRGVDSIFPQADRVHFFEDDSTPLRVAFWPEVVRVMGSEMQRQPDLPIRFRVNAFPTSEQLVAMGARQL
jgi:hypothetical protein